MLKKIISTMLATVLFTTLLAPNRVEAKYFNIKTPGEEEPSTGDGGKSAAIEIIKHLGTNVETSIKTIDDNAGNSAQGSNGISVAFAYLTPQKQFGAVIRKNINILSNSAPNEKSYDEIGGVWNKSLKQTDIQTFYENAVSDFENNQTIKNSISAVTADDIVNNRVAVQEANDRRTFVAATLYVRWFYDVNTQRKDYTNLYLDCVPALSKYNGSDGPYVSWGDFFSSSEKLIPGKNPNGIASSGLKNSVQNIENRKTLASNAYKYVRNLQTITGKAHTGLYLTYDPVYGTSTSPKSDVYTYETKPFYEKSFEYRRYFKGYGGGSSDYYEIVYPVEYHKITNNSTEKPMGIKSSIEAKTIFTDSTKTNVSRYEFDINVSPLVAETSGVETLESPKKYTVDNKVSTSSPSEEPPEDKVDVWQKVMSTKLEIHTKAGEWVCTKYPNSNSETIIVYPSEVEYKNLTGCIATLTIQYNTFCRFLESKEVYSYKYEWYDGKDTKNNKTYEYSTIYNKLYGKPEVITKGLNEITAHHNNSKPRTIYTYTTLGLNDAPLTHTVKDIIIGADGGDPVSPELIVKVNPPNALTILEGGVFDINMEFDPNGISIGRGSSSTYVWIENLVVKPIVVTAQNGEVIYRKDTPLTSFSNTNLRETINAVTAKPSHVGKATVTVDYTYTLVEEYHGTRWKGYDNLGNDIYEDYVETYRTESKGTAKDYFNIYSLTATTTK